MLHPKNITFPKVNLSFKLTCFTLIVGKGPLTLEVSKKRVPLDWWSVRKESPYTGDQ